MAANFGRFTDRSPLVCAAGKPTNDFGNSVGVTMHQYEVDGDIEILKHNDEVLALKKHDDKLQASKHAAEYLKEESAITKTVPTLESAQGDYYGEIRHILQPPVETRYQTLINDLKETTYSSYWNKQVGKVKDQVPGLPKGTDPNKFTFGLPTQQKTTAKELINPPIRPYEVLWNSQQGHNLYRKTHNDYNPSEKVNREYITPPYDPDKRYGQRTNYDPRGVLVRCACEWHQKEPVVFASKLQADHHEKRRPQLGKALTPNRNIECVEDGHRFGKPLKYSLYGVDELLKDANCPPCVLKRDFLQWMASLNTLRNNLKARKDDDFNIDDFEQKLQYYDKEHTNCIPLDIFYEVCLCHRILFNRENIESLLNVLNIIGDGKINYKKFIAAVDVNKKFEIMPFNDVPKQNQYYTTSQQADNCDFLVVNNSEMEAAGLPSIRNDLEINKVPTSGCRADLVHLGDETSAGALLNPSIYTNHGLNYRDFFAPRSPDTLRKLFEQTGYNFPNDTFDKLWEMGVEKDQTGQVSVETFRNLLNDHFTKPKLAVDETECGTNH